MDSSPGKPESNRKIADILHDHGDDLSRVREIDHWAYFPSDDARATFIRDCTALGMTISRTMDPDEHSAQFGVVFFHVDAPNTRLMDDLTAQLIAFAQAVEGEYDGWETQILDRVVRLASPYRRIYVHNMSIMIRNIAIAAALAGSLTPLAAHADSDAPCSASLRDRLKIANAAPDVCETTTRLIPGRAVVLALWSTDPDSPQEIPFAAVLDRKTLDAGHREFLYKRKAMGESLQPFLFNGKTVSTAIADFDGSGRVGWAMWGVPDADYFFDITVYDPKSKKFIEARPDDGANQMTFSATDLDARVQLSPGQVLIPVCDSSPGTPPKSTLYFNVVHLKNGKVETGSRIVAATATADERKKCAQAGQ